MAKHTPGPWRIEGEDEVPEGVPVIEIAAGEAKTWTQIAYVQPGTMLEPRYSTAPIFKLNETDRANARLIAAAPDLLEALDLLYDALETYAPDYMHGREKKYYTKKALKALSAARGDEK